MRAFYNEIDRYCCDWLQNLMDAAHITPGTIDDRSIADLSPDDLDGYERCHFFAGIAGWEFALSLSGYTGPVWTGSCPCQPFSAAGKGKASEDERHLWPIWFELIKAVRPPVIFGEQVEAAIGWGWLDLVHSDLEPEGYAIRSAVLPACSVGAPHIRQRLWFVAQSKGKRLQGGIDAREQQQPKSSRLVFGGSSQLGELADTDGSEQGEGRGNTSQVRGISEAQRQSEHGAALSWGGREFVSHAELRRYKRAKGELADSGPRRTGSAERSSQDDSGERNKGSIYAECGGSNGELAVANGEHAQGGIGRGNGEEVRQVPDDGQARLCNAWSNLIWLPCTDGKQRPTQSGIFPLAHGIPARMAKLRAAGNAIVPQVAAEFIKASM